MFFISCDNWKTCLFLEKYIVILRFSLAATFMLSLLFETSDLKEAHIYFFVSLIHASTKVPKSSSFISWSSHKNVNFLNYFQFSMLLFHIFLYKGNVSEKVQKLVWKHIWLNGWVLIYEISVCGFESSCSH